MSRIHDALKRAEQERATSMGTHVEPVFDQPAFDQPAFNPPAFNQSAFDLDRPEMPREVMPSLQASAPAVASSMSMGSSYESLLARCPQTNWNPDPRTMLFFHEDDTRLGAE